jgi:hypothetical protein
MGRYSATYDVIARLSRPVHIHSDLKQQFLGVFGVSKFPNEPPPHVRKTARFREDQEQLHTVNQEWFWKNHLLMRV